MEYEKTEYNIKIVRSLPLCDGKAANCQHSH